MPQPTASDVHVDALLTDFAIAYMQSQDDFVHARAFAPLAVDKQTNRYRIYTKSDWFRDEAKLLAPGTEAEVTGMNLSSAQYACEVYALKAAIDDQVRANYDAPGDPERDATSMLMHQMMIRLERNFMSTFFATSIWATDVDLGSSGLNTPWTDGAASDPKANVQTGKVTIRTSTGYKPNRMIVGVNVHNALTRHPLIRDQFKYTDAASVTREMLARYFELDDYMVAETNYASSGEGVSPATFAQIAGNHSLLYYAPAAPTLMGASAGKAFVWRGLTGAADLGIRVLNFRNEPKHSDEVEVQAAFDFKVTASDLGYFMANAA